MSELVEKQNLFKNIFDQYSNSEFDKYFLQRPEAQLLFESMRYSFFSGGKRFRPFLSYLMAEAFGVNSNKVLPFSFAVEMIHTYSLIHDDLPCMDNDDFRRGQLTNHKKFGESIALLSGDALLTQAFLHIANAYHEQPLAGLQLVSLLSTQSGVSGMIAGQLLDMTSDNSVNEHKLTLMHELKTGALIYSAVKCVSYLFSFTDQINSLIDNFGKKIGLAFQVKDDLLDANDKDQDFKNFATLIGIESTQMLLVKLSEECVQILSEIKSLNLKFNETDLLSLIQFNLNRES